MRILALLMCSLLIIKKSFSQIGTRFPSERKVIKDPVTGYRLIFLTSKPHGDHKIYQTHNQWTSDGKWLIFQSNLVKGEAMAVNEKSGAMVQVTEGGFSGMLNIARKSMKLYFLRNPKTLESGPRKPSEVQVVEVNLESLFNDSKSGNLKTAEAYQRVCGTIPADWEGGGDMALDGDEEQGSTTLAHRNGT